MSINVVRQTNDSYYTFTLLSDGDKTYGVYEYRDGGIYIYVEFKTTKVKQGSRAPRTVRRTIAAISPAGTRLLALVGDAK